MPSSRRKFGLLLAGVLLLSACSPARSTPVPQEKATAPEAPARVELSSDSQRLVGLQTAAVQVRWLKTTLTTTGEVVANADREAHVTSLVAGRVQRIAKTIGDRVERGEVMAILESIELGQAQADYLQAQAKYELARDVTERQRNLFRDNLSARKEVQAAENDLRLAQIELEKDTNHLKLLGFASERIVLLARRRQVDPTIPLVAPIGGTIVSKHVTLGELLEPNAAEPAFVISDTSELWVTADIYEKDLARVQVGQSATITTSAFPGHAHVGRVSLISAALDKETRSAKARIVVMNQDQKFKPEMFVSARIDLGEQATLAVPKQAVQEEEQRKFVYVPVGSASFEERPVHVGAEYPQYLQVLDGLKPGQRVVTRGSFELRSQARKGTFAGEE